MGGWVFFVIISFFFFSGRSHQQIFSGRCFWNCPSKPFMKPCWDLFKRGRLAYAKCTPNQVVSEKTHAASHRISHPSDHLKLKVPMDNFPHKKMPYKTWMKKCCAHLKWKRPGVLAVLFVSSWSIHPRGPKIGYVQPTQPLFSIIICIHRSIQKTPFPKKEQKIISKHEDHHPNVQKKKRWKKMEEVKKL